jgi:hypothetical protein
MVRVGCVLRERMLTGGTQDRDNLAGLADGKADLELFRREGFDFRVPTADSGPGLGLGLWTCLVGRSHELKESW